MFIVHGNNSTSGIKFVQCVHTLNLSPLIYNINVKKRPGPAYNFLQVKMSESVSEFHKYINPNSYIVLQNVSHNCIEQRGGGNK